MTPPQKKKPSGTTSAKQAKKGAKPAPRKRAKAPTKDAAKAAPKGGAKPKDAVKKTATKRAAKTPAVEPAAAQDAAPDLQQCAALTTKGTRCRLKPSDETLFCARHQDATTVAPEAAPLVQPQKNGQVDVAPRPAKAAEGPPAVEEGPTAAATKGRAKPVARRPRKETASGSEAAPAAPPEDSEDASDEVPASDEDEEFVLYASEYSTTLEASPYDDQVSKRIAEGEEDVDLVEEHQMGRGSRGSPRHQRSQPRQRDERQQEQRPRMTQEEAEAKALEKLGPRPEIAPEEDLDEILVTYDRKFKSEVNHLMGRKRRKRGRRGGRRRGQDGEGGRGGGGGGQGGGRRGGGGGRGGGRRGGKRRGRGSGGGQGGSGGDGASSGGGNARRGPPKNVARDSPLANNRPSRGPKRAVQPRRRREPDV